jgi:hypothetical protein
MLEEHRLNVREDRERGERYVSLLMGAHQSKIACQAPRHHLPRARAYRVLQATATLARRRQVAGRGRGGARAHGECSAGCCKTLSPSLTS